MSHPIRHLHLRVRDVGRSVAFYRRHFGMTVKQAFGDDLVFLSDGHGFDLALGQEATPTAVPRGFHFGCRLASAAAVREAHRSMAAGGAEILPVGEHEGGYVTFVVVDPDGYHVELYFEPVLAEPIDGA